VEPFAGSAAYATLHHDRDVILVEIDPAVAELWRYLVRAKASEIRRLPLPAKARPSTTCGASLPKRAR
jgi:hypothetical protein